MEPSVQHSHSLVIMTHRHRLPNEPFDVVRTVTIAYTAAVNHLHSSIADLSDELYDLHAQISICEPSGYASHLLEL